MLLQPFERHVRQDGEQANDGAAIASILTPVADQYCRLWARAVAMRAAHLTPDLPRLRETAGNNRGLIALTETAQFCSSKVLTAWLRH